MIANSTPLLVSKGREAHRPDASGTGARCGYRYNRVLTRITYVQLLVWVKPTWCPDPNCFNGKDPS